MSRDAQIKPQEQSKAFENKSLSPEKAREIRGYSILAKGDMPTIVDEEHFFVPSQSSDKKYKVIHLNGWSCECPDFQKRKAKCKHIVALELFLKLRDSQSNDVLELQDSIQEEKILCPKCKGDNIIKRGIRKTQTEHKQRYACNDCHKRFVTQIVDRTKVNAKMITLVMDLYYKGLSLRDIKDTVKQFFSIDLHHETIRRYILRFTEAMNKYVENYKPKLGNKWHIDEQKVKTKEKDKWVWSWNIVDADTRFLIANNITESRFINDSRKVLQKAKELTDKRPHEIISDGLQAYTKAIRKEYGKYGMNPEIGLKTRVDHIRLKTIRDQINNNVIERYHNDFREFDKVRRGIDNVQAWNNGFALYHNFIKTNSTIGMTPSEKAEIRICGSNNRWLSLLRQSNNGKN